MIAASGIIRTITAFARVLVSSSESGHLTKKEAVCFVNGQMGVCRVCWYHFASNLDDQKVTFVCSMFIVRARKFEVFEKVV